MRRYIYISVMVAIALSLSLIETLIPIPFIAPGAKLGLSNVVVLVSLVILGFKEAMIISVLKSMVLLLVTGSVSNLIYSMAGAVTSCIVMAAALKWTAEVFSLIGISILGSVAHNTAQIAVSAMVLQNIMMFSYLPVLILVGLGTGYFVGLTSIYITGHMKKLKLWKGDTDET